MKKYTFEEIWNAKEPKKPNTKIMEIDIKKLMVKSPKDVFEAIDMMTALNSELVDAIYIIDSALKLNTADHKEINEMRMKDFISKYTK